MSKVGLATLNNFCMLWALGVIPSCLTAGMTQALVLECMGQIGSKALDRFYCTARACTWLGQC